jgi:hypothetical protein
MYLSKERRIVLLTLPLWSSPLDLGSEIIASEVLVGCSVGSSSARGCAMGREIVALALLLMPP